MELEYSMKPFFTDEKYNFINKNLFNMNNEETIAWFVNPYNHFILEDIRLNEVEEYIKETFNKVDDLTKIKYLLFKMKKNPKGKYHLIKEFIKLIFQEKDKILNIIFDYNFNLPLLIALIDSEKIYKEKKKDIRKFIEELYEIKDDFSDLCYVNHFIKFYKEDTEKQLKVLKRVEEENAPQNILRTFENTLELGKNLEKEVKDFIINKIIEVSLKESKRIETNSMSRMFFLETTIFYSRLNNDKKLEDECLVLHQKAVEDSKKDMNPLKIKLSEETIEAQNKINDFLKEIFSGSKSNIEDKINNLTNIIYGEGITFKPYPRFKSLNEIFSKSQKSIFSQIAKTVYLSDDRRIPDEEEPDYKQLKSIYYEYHVNQIIYVFHLLKQDLSFTKREISKILKKKLGNSDIGFLNEILEAYFKEKTFNFISMSMSFAERTLRKIYKTIHQRDINTLNKAQESQVKVKLTDVLNDNDIKKATNEDFIEYSKWLLNLDSEGFNVRNKVSHGFVEYDFYTKELADLILHYLINIIYLDKYLKEKVSKKLEVKNGLDYST